MESSPSTPAGTPDVEYSGPGGKPIMFYAMLALCEAGDEVIYPNPGFPIYESMINFAGAKAVPIPLRMENEFSLDADELRSHALGPLAEPAGACGAEAADA